MASAWPVGVDLGELPSLSLWRIPATQVVPVLPINNAAICPVSASAYPIEGACPGFAVSMPFANSQSMQVSLLMLGVLSYWAPGQGRPAGQARKDSRNDVINLKR